MNKFNYCESRNVHFTILRRKLSTERHFVQIIYFKQNLLLKRSQNAMTK